MRVRLRSRSLSRVFHYSWRFVRVGEGAADMRPNLAVNRTPAGGAGRGERFVGAGYLTR